MHGRARDKPQFPRDPRSLRAYTPHLRDFSGRCWEQDGFIPYLVRCPQETPRTGFIAEDEGHYQ